MILSIWRYAHLALALVAGLFLILASVTGGVLALEPLQKTWLPYRPVPLSSVTLAETMAALKDEYDDVLSIKVDANDFLLAQVVAKTERITDLYVHPITGKALGKPNPRHPFFQWMTTLHRSLFLKGIGRFVVGLSSFLLCLIAISGWALIIKRQGGWGKFFSKVQKDYFELRYHVIIGRWLFLPILIIAASGVYLSLEKFSLLPSARVVHGEVEPEPTMEASTAYESLPVFKGITLDNVRYVTYPFSEFPEDYFEISLYDKERYVHQYTGATISERPYPFTFLASKSSLLLHTGQGSTLWSLVLFLSSIGLLFFIYSGYCMWRKRVRNAQVLAINKDRNTCSHIILVGSETGTTYAFAKTLAQALNKVGKHVFVDQINNYGTYALAEHLIFLTATYGDGDPPANAKNFRALLASHTLKREVAYSVIGFGSLRYPKYCQFAKDLDGLLASLENFKRVLPLYKINNRSGEAFTDWAKQWGRATDTPIQTQNFLTTSKEKKQSTFEVVEKTNCNVDNTFLLRLRPKGKPGFRSGDLWGFTPVEDGVTRWYSIAKVNNHLLLSIKKHPYGVSSSFLNTAEIGEVLTGTVKKNPEFHFPKAAPAVVLIANGTGMAPFLGMLAENTDAIPVDLYWGGRSEDSIALYQKYLDRALELQYLNRCHVALSKGVGQKQYVQDLLQRDGEQIAKKMEEGAIFMLCGSIAMQNGVLATLEKIALTYLKRPLNDFEQNHQLKMDCY